MDSKTAMARDVVSLASLPDLNLAIMPYDLSFLLSFFFES
jgi:hypothetical protein